MTQSNERIDPLLNLLNQRPHPDWQWRFEPDVQELSQINAVALCHLALLAYSPPNDVKDYLEDKRRAFDIDTFTPLRQAETQCFVIRRREGVFVSFRGTEPTKIVDWLSDVNYHRIDFCKSHGIEPSVIPGLVHGGFAAELNIVRKDLLDVVHALATPGEPVWITGHSLGGALAVLAAAVLKFEVGQNIGGLYTYGQPRVGDAAFCKAMDHALDGQFFRGVNDQDIVPHVPPIGLPHPLELRLSGLAQNPDPSMRDSLFAFLADVRRVLDPETFSHCGELLMFAKDGTLIKDENERDGAWDEREMPIGLRLTRVFSKAPQLIREALNTDVLLGARFIDHDPRYGYLPKLVLQVDDPEWRKCYPLV
jgi:triacylglycerol lipase